MSLSNSKKAIKQLEASSSYSSDELRLIKSFLPLNYAEVIKSKLEKLEIEISTETIIAVLNGRRRDRHGIVEIALEMAIQEKKKMEATVKKISLLTK